jgi:tryptophanase
MSIVILLVVAMNDMDTIVIILGSIVGLAIFLAGWYLAYQITKTKTVEKWQRNQFASYVAMMNCTGKRPDGLYYNAQQELMTYMEQNGIREMECGGHIVNYHREKAKERPAPERVKVALLAMDYNEQQADNIINHGLLQLGTKAKFDELLNFCLENRRKKDG